MGFSLHSRFGQLANLTSFGFRNFSNFWGTFKISFPNFSTSKISEIPSELFSTYQLSPSTMEKQPPSFRDVVVGASPHPQSQLKDISPSDFVQQVALFEPTLEYTQQGAVGKWLMEQFLEEQIRFPFQNTSLQENGTPIYPVLPAIPYYEELGLPPIDPGRSPKTWSPSNWRFEDSSFATALEKKWERCPSFPNLSDGSWSPWKSKDFLSFFFAAGESERPASSIPTETVAASTSQKPSNWIVWPPTPPEENEDALLPQMLLNLSSKQQVNFTHNAIQFQIEVENVPPKLSVKTDMIVANAFGPSGEGCECTIRKEGRKSTIFSGHFKARGEIGFYSLQAHIFVPKEFWVYTKDVAVTGTVQVFVSKNYLVDSQSCNSFKCTFGPVYGLPSMTGNLAFSKVWGLTCDPCTNHIYYSDRVTSKIYCVDPEGRIIATFGQPTQPGMAAVNRPTGLAFDSIHRRLVVVDKDHHRVSFFTPGGQYIDSFGNLGHANGEFNYPWDVAVSPVDGKIAVADAKNKRLQLFGTFGEFLGKYSVYEKAPLDYKTHLDFPRACSFDMEGKYLYATDFHVQNVLELTTDMRTCRKVIPDGEQRKLRRPQGIAVDEHGNLLVADSVNDSIRFMDREGDLLCSIFSVSNRPLDFPVNLTIMGDKKLAVLDGKGRIHIF